MFVKLGIPHVKRVTFTTPKAPIADGKKCYVGRIRELTKKRLEVVDRMLGVEAVLVEREEGGISDDTGDKWLWEAVDGVNLPQLPVFHSGKGKGSRPCIKVKPKTKVMSELRALAIRIRKEKAER